MKIRHGSTRSVFIIRGLAIKMPRLYIKRVFRAIINREHVKYALPRLYLGRASNRLEWTTWREHRSKHLCPVLWCDPWGWLLVAKRADTCDDKGCNHVYAIYSIFEKNNIKVGDNEENDIHTGNIGHIGKNVVIVDYGN